MGANEKALTHISANENLDANSISNGCKVMELFSSTSAPKWKDKQNKKLEDVFTNNVLTMKDASVRTGIDRSNICWFVHDRRGDNTIYPCGKALCRITKARAMRLTMNVELAVAEYKSETNHLWRYLPEDAQSSIVEAIRSYLLNRSRGFFISSFLDDETRETWLKVQEHIDERINET